MAVRVIAEVVLVCVVENIVYKQLHGSDSEHSCVHDVLIAIHMYTLTAF